jgi:hypothetical protein
MIDFYGDVKTGASNLRPCAVPYIHGATTHENTYEN